MREGRPLQLAALHDIDVAVTVLLGKASVKLSEVLAYGEGTIVPLGARVDSPVYVLVNGTPVATGDLVSSESGELAVEIRDVFESPPNGETER